MSMQTEERGGCKRTRLRRNVVQACRVEHAWWYMGVCKVEQLTFRRKVLVVYFLCSPEAEQ